MIRAECRDCGARAEFDSRGQALQWQRIHRIDTGHFVRIITPASKHTYGKRP